MGSLVGTMGGGRVLLVLVVSEVGVYNIVGAIGAFRLS